MNLYDKKYSINLMQIFNRKTNWIITSERYNDQTLELCIECITVLYLVK
jgi:hypothetical protein